MSKVIRCTTNYDLFERDRENREVDLDKHKKLYDSMKKYGFLDVYPIVVKRLPNGKFKVKEGQHRLAVARQLGLPVYYVETDVDFDIAEVNCTSVTWALKDYAMKFNMAGKKDYGVGLDFSERFRVPLGISFALLAGTTCFVNCKEDFFGGTFAVKDSRWAEDVVSVFFPIGALSKQVRNVHFLKACMALCRVSGIDMNRLMNNAKKKRDLLVSYSSREAYLQMLEQIYNFGSKRLFSLKNEAIMAMQRRNPTCRKKKGNSGIEEEHD